ncbi:hypothetical protein CDAR_392131 [Caerostris darwini]|uniref:Ycf15 n=1 Tax=Caerostris darwini TaxID=1538125 RepID=A0AAV4UGJ8_9ARAC|nr:hypothetical protein CDAR_392131 [Caerostris darwini]
MWYKCIKTGAGGNAKRGMIAIIPLFECDGSIGPQGESRDSRRSIGCVCGYSTSFFPSTPPRKDVDPHIPSVVKKRSSISKYLKGHI